MPRLLAALLLGACAAFPVFAFFPQHVVPADSGYNPKVAGPSNEGLNAIKRMRVPAPLKIDLYAAEPLLANPVAFCFDEKGRCYVAETFRLHSGVTDNRSHMNWIVDELASRTVEDRVAMYKKYLKPKEFDSYAKDHDRVRLIWDSKGDGVADKSVVFADGFNTHAAGVGSGVLARGNKVWYTCIPDLWLLEDTKGANKADVKKALSTGYGVHVAFIGHDTHGLKMGPDGKLYFSVGDRGLNVTTPDGRKLVAPDCGSVLRCNPDGSELEIFASGLRNPQELAFDQYGNLFTGDNNADGGDPARFVHVVEGGDSGWRIGWQYLKTPTQLGPWNAEKMHGLQYDGQAAHLVPPVHHLGSGPSGLTYHPGTAQLPDKYKEHFFLCDFRGGPGGSGIHAFKLKQKGASFELVGAHQFCWSTLATDCDFGPDGAFYLSDWVDGWGLTGKGRIYKVSEPGKAKDELVLSTKKLLAEGMSERKLPELLKLLEHADMRVRLEAQYRLAELKPDAAPALAEVAAANKNQLARLHAIWGLGQIARRNTAALKPLLALTADPEIEVRSQAAKVLGTAKLEGAAEKLTALLKDTEPRVRFYATQSLGKQGKAEAAGPIAEMLRANADKDAYLRHAGVMALVTLGDNKAIDSLASDASPSVRLAALLAMRRLEMPEVARFLNDADSRLVLEAARAINDVPIKGGQKHLAAILPKAGSSAPLLYRALNANFREGKKENAQALSQFAGRNDAPEALRIEALKMLGDWESPHPLDRIVGLHRPLDKRPAADAADAIRVALGPIFTGPNKVRGEAAKVAAKYGIKEVGPVLFELVADATKPGAIRAETLQALETLKDARLSKAMEIALADADPRLRAQGRRVLAKLDPAKGLEAAKTALAKGEVIDKQGALAILAELKQADVDTLLQQALTDIKQWPAAIQLDVLEAAAKRSDPAVKKLLADYESARSPKDHLAKYREAMVGGEAERGRRIFFEKSEVSCLRCHKIKGTGGDVGPALDGIGTKQNREYLLEALVEPNKQIAKGYETVNITLVNGQSRIGILKSEDAKEVRLMTAEGNLIVVPKDQIDERSRGRTSMPEDLTRQLSRVEVRDLVEFLATLKE